MKSFKITGTDGSYTINLPTSIEEIDSEYLTSVCNAIVPAPNWSVVAIVSRSLLNPLLLSIKKNSRLELPITPLFVKGNEESEGEFVKNIKPGTPVIITTSELSMGSLVRPAKNVLSIDYLMKIMKDDKNLLSESLGDKQQYCFVDFKVVPNSVIHGCIGEDAAKVDTGKFVKINMKATSMAN